MILTAIREHFTRGELFIGFLLALPVSLVIWAYITAWLGGR